MSERDGNGLHTSPPPPAPPRRTFTTTKPETEDSVRAGMFSPLTDFCFLLYCNCSVDQAP